MVAESKGLPTEATHAPHPRARRWRGIRSVDRHISDMRIAQATTVLVGVAVIFAVVLHVTIESLFYPVIQPATLISAAIVTILVGTPIIAYSQVLIRKQITSRGALRRLTEQLALALDQAEAGNEAKSQFLAAMSHELRTPLNAIIGFSELIRDQKLGSLGVPRYGEYARDIHASGLHLLATINDMLDLARIKAGQILVEDDRACDLAEMFETVLATARPLAERHRIALDPALPEGRVGLAAAERVIRRVLLNILSNAIKFTPPGGRVSLSAQLGDGGELTIAVTDRGVGMTAAEIAVALTPFGQVDAGLNRKHGGTGLGLPLAKSLTELYDGRLTINSAPRYGTKVTLVFPAVRVVAVAEPPALAVAS